MTGVCATADGWILTPEGMSRQKGKLAKLKVPTEFTPEDVTSITLYGDGAVWRPALCPKSITFTGRARSLPSLDGSRIGFLPGDIRVNGRVCKTREANVVFDMFPIGRPGHFPPQWIFERSSLSGDAVNLTCGDTSFAIRYGYLNDVKAPKGFLDSRVVYFDFAVIPYTEPFAFCSYASRRENGLKPIHFAPFPSIPTWNRVSAINEKRSLDTDAGDDSEQPSGTASGQQQSGQQSGGQSGGQRNGADADAKVTPEAILPTKSDDSGHDEDTSGSPPMPSPLADFRSFREMDSADR